MTSLCVQVAERQLQAREADQQEAEEEEEARRAEQLTSARLQQEARTMAEQGYRPKVGAAGDGPAASPSAGLLPGCAHAVRALLRPRGLPALCASPASAVVTDGLFRSLVGPHTALEVILLWLLSLQPKEGGPEAKLS